MIIQLVGPSSVRWAEELRQITADIMDLPIEVHSEKTWSGQATGDILAFEEETVLEVAVKSLNRKAKAILYVTTDPQRIPKAWSKGDIDDVLCFPFRKLEVISKLKRFVDLLKWEEVEKLNMTYRQLIDELKNDVELATRLQKVHTPNRFSNLKGLKVASRYMAGMRGGGDYFDLAETQNSEGMSLLLTHATSYGLSSSVLNVLLKVAMKWASAQQVSVMQNLRLIYDELILTLGEKDELSLLHGWINRKDLVLKLVNMGGAHCFYAEKEEPFRELSKQGPALQRDMAWPIMSEMEVPLSPDDRIVLLSHGVVRALGGVGSVIEALNEMRKRDTLDAVNELTFQVKQSLPDVDDFPAQDCTIVVFDVDSRVIRLAR